MEPKDTMDVPHHKKTQPFTPLLSCGQVITFAQIFKLHPKDSHECTFIRAGNSTKRCIEQTP